MLEKRLEFHESMMNIVESLEPLATCKRRKVAAVIVDRHYRIVSTGYNGTPNGFNHCDLANICEGSESKSGSDLDKCLAVHAEQNALLQNNALKYGKTIYLSCSPCIHCIKMLLQSNVKNIVYNDVYWAHFPTVKQLWEKADRQIISFSELCEEY